MNGSTPVILNLVPAVQRVAKGVTELLKVGLRLRVLGAGHDEERDGGTVMNRKEEQSSDSDEDRVKQLPFASIARSRRMMKVKRCRHGPNFKPAWD